MNWPHPPLTVQEAISAFEAEPLAKYRCRCGWESRGADAWAEHAPCPMSPLPAQVSRPRNSALGPHVDPLDIARTLLRSVHEHGLQPNVRRHIGEFLGRS